MSWVISFSVKLIYFFGNVPFNLFDLYQISSLGTNGKKSTCFPFIVAIIHSLQFINNPGN